MKQPPVAIAGGGIAGLSAALAMAHAGRAVRVFERDSAPGREGAGVQLSPNASRHLRAWGVLDQLQDRALAPRAVIVRRGRDGAVLSQLDLRDAERRWGAPFLVAHRADLHGALLKAASCRAGIEYVTGQTVTRWSGQHIVTVETSAGDVDAACLVVADGVGSRLREQFEAGATLHAASHVAWRTLIPADQCPAFARAPASNLWLGPDAHLVHYPLRGGTMVNVVVILAAGSACWNETRVSQTGASGQIATWLRHWCREARELIMLGDDWRVWPLPSRAPVQRLAHDRIAVVGDAAHPMMPFLAQGAAQAIEDAAVLGDTMAEHADDAAALAAYAKKRSERVRRVVSASRRQERLYHLSGPLALARDVAIKTLGNRGLLLATDWIYRG